MTDVLELLRRPDKWYLGQAPGLLFAPTAPVWLDSPGFWDVGHYLHYAVESLFTYALVDERGQVVPLRARGRDWRPDRLVVEFDGESAQAVDARIAALQAWAARSGGPTAITLAVTPQQIGNVLKVRKAGLGLLMSMRGDYKPVPFIEDAAVPVEHLADYVSGVGRIVAEHGATMALYAHASAGCLHIRPLLDLAVRRFNAFARLQSDLAEARGKLVERETIDRAKRILMDSKGVSEPEAYSEMRRKAMSTNQRIADIAAAVVTAHELMGGD